MTKHSREAAPKKGSLTLLCLQVFVRLSSCGICGAAGCDPHKMLPQFHDIV